MTTIYRQFDKLVEEGTVKKYILDASSSACFEYVDTHSACKENGFKADMTRTVIYGLCENCQ